jgi:hypothetical protein
VVRRLQDQGFGKIELRGCWVIRQTPNAMGEAS